MRFDCCCADAPQSEALALAAMPSRAAAAVEAQEQSMGWSDAGHTAVEEIDGGSGDSSGLPGYGTAEPVDVPAVVSRMLCRYY